jgi:hypothetical protein
LAFSTLVLCAAWPVYLGVCHNNHTKN